MHKTNIKVSKVENKEDNLVKDLKKKLSKKKIWKAFPVPGGAHPSPFLL